MMRDIFFSYMAHGDPSLGAGKACSNYNGQKDFLCITWKGRIVLYKDQGLCMWVGIIVMNSPCIAISTQFPFFLIISYYYNYCYYYYHYYYYHHCHYYSFSLSLFQSSFNCNIVACNAFSGHSHWGWQVYPVEIYMNKSCEITLLLCRICLYYEGFYL